MKEINKSDLIFCLRRLPKKFLENIVKTEKWNNRIFIGGGFIRSVIQNEKINDVDVFVKSKDDAEHLALEIKNELKSVEYIHKTEYALTLVGIYPTIQIIHKWNFDKAEDVIKSFDFTICNAVIYYEDGKYKTHCEDSYYEDLASKRLVYTKPKRIEEAGGSTLRVLKYYNKGFRIPLDSLGSVLARLFMAVDFDQIAAKCKNKEEMELEVGKVLTGLLRTVDPLIDPTAEAHLPSQNDESNNIIEA